MDIQKNSLPAPSPCTPTAAELRLIHTFTRAELAAEELYVFRAALCDNEIDRDGERFPTESLVKLAELFPGKTGLFDHSMRAADQCMRVYSAEVVTDAQRKNSLGEPYAALVGKVYLLRGESTAALCKQIDAGIHKEISVSCAVKRVRCSVCGKPFGREGCTHRKGEKTDGVPCHALLEEPTDAYEFSFVAVPAQPGAGVTKAYAQEDIPQERRMQTMEDLRKFLDACGGGAVELQPEAAQAMRKELSELEALAEDGRGYREALQARVCKASLGALPALEQELLRRMCAPLASGELEALAHALEKQTGKLIPLRPQLCPPAQKAAEVENQGYQFN
ncbi:MAG: hypothetical protein LBC83_01195 [Oscillospiraceae bacterium]|jgi:hypothetical protein|nr:hypothetical protein [Oscillospiraceae bacterium]